MVSVNVFIKVLSVSLSPPRLLIVKATCVPSASPPCACGNLLLVFKEQRSHRGGLGEVCATDSGAGQVNEPYCLPLQISVRQQPLAFCLLLAPHTHTHTLHTFMRQTHFSHTPRGLLRWSQRGRTHQWRIQIVFDSHYRWLFTH